MSADNFYLIRKHPVKGFSAVMGFASCDTEDSLVVDASCESFPTMDQAIESVVDSYAEYGVQVHPECLKV
jgi:hypothetical protein